MFILFLDYSQEEETLGLPHCMVVPLVGMFIGEALGVIFTCTCVYAFKCMEMTDLLLFPNLKNKG